MKVTRITYPSQAGFNSKLKGVVWAHGCRLMGHLHRIILNYLIHPICLPATTVLSKQVTKLIQSGLI